MMLMISYIYGDREQDRKENLKGVHPREILKTWVLREELCVQSQWEFINYIAKERCLHRDAENIMCTLHCRTQNHFLYTVLHIHV